MCTRPITQDGKTFACRTCDECIATRRHNWVARAMAEKSLWPYCMIVALTYGNETQEQRDSAAMFNYADVRAFLKRLRSAMRRKDNAAQLRFICAGEQGDRNGRCHWHLILYSNVDLTTIGEYFDKRGKVENPRSMISVGKNIKRLHWSMWATGEEFNGFVTLQAPDEGGFSYVLSYCLKDQFTPEKAMGTGRYGHTDNFATGLFRMSKRPPIGEKYLSRYFERHLERGSLPPGLKITIPDMSGYWTPSGNIRKQTLAYIHAVNNRIEWDTGAPAHQWTTLVTTLTDSDKEYLNGPQNDLEDLEDEAFTLAKRGRFDAGEKNTARIRRICGAEVPCRTCLHYLDDETLHALNLARYAPDPADPDRWVYTSTDGRTAFERQNTPAAGPNRYCRNTETPEFRRAFPRSAEKLQKEADQHNPR